MNHKRHPNRNRRAGCKLCKPWKSFGVTKHTAENEKFSDFRRYNNATQDLKEILPP